jgi:hypothetical protein
MVLFSDKNQKHQDPVSRQNSKPNPKKIYPNKTTAQIQKKYSKILEPKT